MKSGQRYYSLKDYFVDRFGEPVGKLSLDGGFTCPNRENGAHGCLFCSESGAGEFAGNVMDSLEKQIIEQKKFLAHKGFSKFMAYFQNFTNTYKPVEELRGIYYKALEQKDVIGIAIATRPDCLDDGILDLLEEINERYELWIELGFQTSNLDTASIIRRGYDNGVFVHGVSRLKNRNIKVLTHLIYGLPFETKDDFLESVKFVKDIGLWGIKFHSLYIQTDSDLYGYYLENRFPILSREEYIEGICDALELLPENMVVHRLTGDGKKELLFLPNWSRDKLSVIGGIQKELKIRGSKQGSSKG